MSKCAQCGAEFEAKRVDAQYCSAKCRVTANRTAAQVVTDKLNVTPNVVTVTDNVTDNQPVFKCQKSTKDAPNTVWRSKGQGREWVIPGYHFHVALYTNCLAPECSYALN